MLMVRKSIEKTFQPNPAENDIVYIQHLIWLPPYILGRLWHINILLFQWLFFQLVDNCIIDNVLSALIRISWIPYLLLRWDDRRETSGKEDDPRRSDFLAAFRARKPVLAPSWRYSRGYTSVHRTRGFSMLCSQYDLFQHCCWIQYPQYHHTWKLVYSLKRGTLHIVKYINFELYPMKLTKGG